MLNRWLKRNQQFVIHISPDNYQFNIICNGRNVIASEPGILSFQDGQGAFGLVFLVASTETGLMAAKVMQSQVFDPIEWDAAGRLQEGDPIPFIIQFKFARQFDDLVVILMEFANLKSLDHIIKRNYDLSGGTVRAIAKQLFEGLKLIHAKGLVHRDIRGENILMHCPPGSQRVIVKIADFGLVKIQNLIQRTMLMSAKGTPLNMAPELVIGDRKADSKVDIWSVGVVLYQLVAHQYPIKATSVPELQTLMRQNKTINRPSLIRDNLFWDLLLNLLQFDRTKRFSADQALQHPYFTSEQAQNEISQYSHQIASASLALQQNGDTSISQYDIDSSYIVPGNEIKTVLNYDPEIELQPIYSQIISQQQQQQQQIVKQQQQQQLFESGFQLEDNFSHVNMSMMNPPKPSLLLSTQQQQQNQLQLQQSETNILNNSIPQDHQQIPQQIVNPPLNQNQYNPHQFLNILPPSSILPQNQIIVQPHQQTHDQQQPVQNTDRINNQQIYQLQPQLNQPNINQIPDNFQPEQQIQLNPPQQLFIQPSLIQTNRKYIVPGESVIFTQQLPQIKPNDNLQHPQIDIMNFQPKYNHENVIKKKDNTKVEIKMNEIKHQQKQNNNQQQIPCEICKQLINLNKFEEHNQIHQQQLIQTLQIINAKQQQQYTGEIFNNERKNKDINNQQIPCEICNKMILFDQYQQHILEHQQQALEQKRNEEIQKQRLEQEKLKREQEQKDIQFAQQLQEEENKQQLILEQKRKQLQEQQELEELKRQQDQLNREEEEQRRRQEFDQEKFARQLQAEEDENLRKLLEQQRIEKERIEREKQQRIEKERIEREKQQRLEKERLEKEKQQRLEKERQREQEKQQREHDLQQQSLQQTSSLKQIKCPFCFNNVLQIKAIDYNHSCLINQQNRQLLNRTKQIYPLMERYTSSGRFHPIYGQKPQCPFCNQIPLSSILGHILIEHQEGNDLFQRILQFLYEIEQS